MLKYTVKYFAEEFKHKNCPQIRSQTSFNFVEEALERFIVPISPVHFQSWTWQAAASCHNRAASALVLPPAQAQFSGIQPAVV